MNLRSVLLISALGLAVAAQAVGVTKGLVVLRANGTTSAAQTVSLVNYDLTGSLLNTYSVAGLTLSGSATSEGALNLSGDGKSLAFAGYKAAAGTTAVASTSTTGNNAVLRAIGTFDLASGTSTSNTTTTRFSGNNVRSAYSFDSATYFAAGAANGIVTGGFATTNGAPLASNTLTNLRTVNGSGSSLYFSTGSGSARGIYSVNTTTGAQTSILNLGATASPYDFQFLSATSLLVSDDTGTGTIKLYTNSGSGFALSSTFNEGTRSFAVQNGAIYFTSLSGTTLRSVAFDGTSFGATSTLLATAGTGQLFRGVEAIPQAVPEPATMAALGFGALAMLRRRRKA